MTHYDILGVSKNATQDEIRKAYIKLVKKYHPDLYKGDKAYAEKKTKEINNSYDILSDEESRRIYDEEISPKDTTYEYTSPKYDDVGPTYSTVYEEILRNYRQKYRDYFDNRNKAASSYGYYQTRREAERSRQRAAAATNKRYETINKIYDSWDVGTNIKLSLIILMILLISMFIFIGSYIQTVKISQNRKYDQQRTYHAIEPKTDEELRLEQEENAETIKKMEDFLRGYYNSALEYDEDFTLENGIYDIISYENLRVIYESYYSNIYDTYDKFIEHINNDVLVKDN